MTHIKFSELPINCVFSFTEFGKACKKKNATEYWDNDQNTCKFYRPSLRVHVSNKDLEMSMR